MNTTTQNQKGFTLVEIAIVLVIIGLLLGGVLKGQELITNSKIKSLTKDLEGIVAASYAYQDRTGRLAGDTDSDGAFDNVGLFWSDLKDEGFLSGVTGTGSTAKGPVHGLNGSFSTVISAASTMFPNKNYICASNVEESIAEVIDKKLDDGVPNTGDIRVGATESGTALATYTAPETGRFLCRVL